MAKRKHKNQTTPAAAPLQPGVSPNVEPCNHCREPVRKANVMTAKGVVAHFVNAAPVEFVQASGMPVSFFRPHLPSCKNPPQIHLPGGGRRIIV